MIRKLLIVTVLSTVVLGGLPPAVQAAPADDSLLPAWFAQGSPGLETPLTPAGPSEQGEVLLTGEDAGRRIELSGGQVLVISLEANPSTGYLWEVDSAATRGSLRQIGEMAFEPKSALIGAPARQIMRFAVLEAGPNTLPLVYHRPWEITEPKRTFSVQVEGVGSFAGIEPPLPNSTTPSHKANSVESPAGLDLGVTASLPSAFNWCSQGGCTSVKDQKSCGSCWAFATSGAFESVIKIQDGVGRDLSEQYLVSCNTDGWGCNGGWWAFDYFEDKVPPGEPEAGAVYEADFPYVASDVGCGAPHSHHEDIASWSYVDGWGSVPSVGALKQTIYDHGPVAAAICTGSSFHSYDGGVFNTDESSSCPPSNPVNHGVVLVGWDDNRGSNGAWRLKNSWGSGWGAGGYMWIEYGTSNVGYGAAYVQYEGGGSGHNPPYTPSSPTPPSGAASQSVDVDLAWSGGDPDGDSVTYDVYLDAGDPSPDELACKDVSSPSCNPGTLDSDTHYYWKVVARDDQDAITTGPVWDFLTQETQPNNPPYTPGSPTPPNGAASQSVDVDLAWSGGDPDGDSVTYDVYLDANDPSPDELVCNDVSSSSCNPGTLDSDTHYYWQVVARDDRDEITTGPVWDFLTKETPTPDPSIHVYTDKDTYSAGETLQFGLDLTNPGPTQTARFILVLSAPWRTYPVVDAPLTLPADFDYSNPQYFAWTLPSLPAATYAWVGVLLPERSEDPIRDDAEWTVTSQASSQGTGRVDDALKGLRIDLSLGE